MEELAQLVLLLLVAALLVNLVRGGPQQVSKWMAAKFLGRAA